MTSHTDNTGDERSLGGLFRGLTEDLSTLVRSEIALAKLELKQAVTKLGGAGAMFAAALFFALCALAFLFVTLILVLALFMPAWVATLIVAVVLLISAVVLVLQGKKKLKGLSFVPATAIASVKTDIQTIKQEMSRSREKGAA